MRPPSWSSRPFSSASFADHHRGLVGRCLPPSRRFRDVPHGAAHSVGRRPKSRADSQAAEARRVRLGGDVLDCQVEARQQVAASQSFPESASGCLEGTASTWRREEQSLSASLAGRPAKYSDRTKEATAARTIHLSPARSRCNRAIFFSTVQGCLLLPQLAMCEMRSKMKAGCHDDPRMNDGHDNGRG